MKTKSIIFALIILLVGSSFGHSQEQPPKDDYSWLNGRWEGTLFDGGRGIINLKVTKVLVEDVISFMREGACDFCLVAHDLC